MTTRSFIAAAASAALGAATVAAGALPAAADGEHESVACGAPARARRGALRPPSSTTRRRPSPPGTFPPTTAPGEWASTG